MKVGQERNSDSATQFPWKTIPKKPHLQKGDDGKGTDKEGVEGKIRQRPDFREAKHTYGRLYKEHVESNRTRKQVNPSSTTKKAKLSTTI